jgi:hypothetical protein
MVNRRILTPVAQHVPGTRKIKQVKLSRYAMETLGGQEEQLLLILDLGTRGGLVVPHLGPLFTPEERTSVPIGQEAGWASELV